MHIFNLRVHSQGRISKASASPHASVSPAEAGETAIGLEDSYEPTNRLSGATAPIRLESIFLIVGHDKQFDAARDGDIGDGVRSRQVRRGCGIAIADVLAQSLLIAGGLCRGLLCAGSAAALANCSRVKTISNTP